MIEKIKQAQIDGRLLNNDSVNYENVEINNPIEIITNLYSGLNQLLKDNKLEYNIESNEGIKFNTITYLKDFEPDYFIIRSSKHDGTLIFTMELFNDVLVGVLQGTAYCKNNKPDDYNDNTFWDYNLDYIIGDIYNFKDYGLKEINGIKMDGMEEIMILPVKVNYTKVR